jgi:hypothetical protein
MYPDIQSLGASKDLLKNKQTKAIAEQHPGKQIEYIGSVLS